ncbi:Uncharacterized protein TCM_027282 [Theobroma cacao]|uniref:Uncharacterized protein n=1 Tax=Theobroma cacao TaxID=3641 RepID=A0A061G908_THECC|nr:Uncharacterized protein TCM_027282 [Theobroma cacao]
MMSHAALKFANKKREDFAVSDAEVVRRGRPETPPFCSCLVIPCFISSSFLLAGYFHVLWQNFFPFYFLLLFLVVCVKELLFDIKEKRGCLTGTAFFP